MDNNKQIVADLEDNIFNRLRKAIRASNPDEHTFYVDSEERVLTTDPECLENFGFKIDDFSIEADQFTLEGHLVGDISKPFREFLASHVVNFTCKAAWPHTDNPLSSTDIHESNLRDFSIPVLHKLHVDIVNAIVENVEKFLVEKNLLGETDPVAGSFNEMFSKK